MKLKLEKVTCVLDPLQTWVKKWQIKQVNEWLQKRNGQLEKKNKALSSSLQKCNKCKLAQNFTRKKWQKLKNSKWRLDLMWLTYKKKNYNFFNNNPTGNADIEWNTEEEQVKHSTS